MGSTISQPIEDFQTRIYIRQTLAQLKQDKKKRDYQLASRVATLRDRVYWMSAFYVTMGAVSLARMIYLRSFSPLPLKTVPYVLVPFMVGYQADAAWGTKLNRIDKEAREIMKDDSGRWWFNEPIELPDLYKEHYVEMMRETNEKLAKMGKPPEKDWAR